MRWQLTLELPPPLSDDLIRDAANDHVTPEEHVQIVLSLVQALRHNHPEKAFLKSFRAYLIAALRWTPKPSCRSL